MEVSRKKSIGGSGGREGKGEEEGYGWEAVALGSEKEELVKEGEGEEEMVAAVEVEEVLVEEGKGGEEDVAGVEDDAIILNVMHAKLQGRDVKLIALLLKFLIETKVP